MKNKLLNVYIEEIIICKSKFSIRQETRQTNKQSDEIFLAVLCILIHASRNNKVHEKVKA